MLRQQECFNLVKAIFNNATDGICIIDSNGIIQWHNIAFQNIFGFSSEELDQNSISIIMPNAYAESHYGYVQTYLQTGQPKIIGTGREVIAKHKNGTLFSIYLSVSESIINEDVFFIGVMHKTTVNFDDIQEKISKLEQLIHEWKHGQQ